MKQSLVRVAVLAMALLLAACSTGPQPQPQLQDYPEPVFSTERIVPEDFDDVVDVYDPWEGMNRRIYNFNYHFDQKVFLPVVNAWVAVVPKFIRVGLHNFYENFRDVGTMANSILQLSPSKFFQSTGRVLVNSTVGLLGTIDVATSMEMARPKEDFGQTLGHWGVGKGPYLIIPFLGPSNLRDGLGEIPDFMLQGELRDGLFTSWVRTPLFLLDTIDTRSSVSFRYYESGSAFEYQTVRWLYSTKRDLDVAK